LYKKMIAEYYNISEDEAVKDYWIDKFEKDVKVIKPMGIMEF